MENLALNTIFYILIFIFPGLLFRKFYFSGDFTKQFQQGNLMERLLWTLFFSTLIITLSVLGFIFLETYTNIKTEEYVSYENVKKLFETLSANKLPEKTDVDKYFYKNYIYLILIIYCISIFSGFVSYKLIRLTNIDSYIPTLRYKNYWYYLIRSKKINEKNNSRNKYLYTNADVLIECKDKTELYSGYVQNYFIDPLTNKLNCIILKDAYKFIAVANTKTEDIEASIENKENVYERHKVYSDKVIYKKNIPGDILTLFDDRIININLTYVEQVLDLKERRYALINSFYYIVLTIIIFTPWLIQYDLILTIKRKIIISLIGYLTLISIRNYLLELLNLIDKPLGFKNFILGMILYNIPLLWFLKILNAWWTLLISFLFFLIMVIILNDSKKQNEKYKK